MLLNLGANTSTYIVFRYLNPQFSEVLNRVLNFGVGEGYWEYGRAGAILLGQDFSTVVIYLNQRKIISNFYINMVFWVETQRDRRS